MFTTIANLRNSSAMQDRVTKVENWLKKQNPNWQPEFVFPIFAIGNSNPVEDVSWVYDNTRTYFDWPEMEAAVIRKIATNQICSKVDHIDNILSRMNRSKAATIAELTEVYNAAYAE